jgi:hypothetical protein
MVFPGQNGNLLVTRWRQMKGEMERAIGGSSDDRMIEMEWSATWWVIMQPASSSDDGVMVRGLKIFDQSPLLVGIHPVQRL